MRKTLLLESLRHKGFSDRIISAFNTVDRENFLPEHLMVHAYEDMALPLFEGSSLSQPSTIAFMLQLLAVEEGQTVIEIGSGSGYVLALLAELIGPYGKLYGIEHQEVLAAASKNRLAYKENVTILVKDGSMGLPEKGPFDRILISASLPDTSIIKNLKSQLNHGGIIVAPVGNSLFQYIYRNQNIEETEFIGYSFVPFVTAEKLK